ncbi:MAG: hypothetical protein LAO31_04910 [Acidobacteriia bacterium]|nr:hypothetical protein [Terriglobia bacterium]
MIVLIMSTLALPNMLEMRNNYNLQGDLRLVQVMIQTGRYNAISHGRQYQVVMQTDPHQVRLQVDDTADPQDPLHVPNFVNCPNDQYCRGVSPVSLSRGVQFVRGGTLTCVFNGSVTGTGFDTTPTGEPYVEVRNKKHEYQVAVSPLGRVRLVRVK